MFGLGLQEGVVVAVFLLVVIWALFSSFIVAYIAREKSRGSGLAWFLVSLFFTPIFAALRLVALPNRKRTTSGDD